MKRIFCLLLTVIISAGVTGCAETPANAGAAPQSPVSETTAAETDDSEGVVPVESVEIVVGDDEGAASVVETAGVATANSGIAEQLKPLELFGGYTIDDDGYIQIEFVNVRKCTLAEYRKYFIGIWDGWDLIYRTCDVEPPKYLIIDDSEKNNCGYWVQGTMWKIGGNVIVSFCRSIGEVFMYWIDIREPNIMYYTELSSYGYWVDIREPGTELSNGDKCTLLYNLNLSTDYRINPLTKTDLPVNESDNGYLGMLRLREMSEDYGIDLDMLCKIDYNLENTDISFSKNQFLDNLPVYLVFEAPNKLVLKTCLMYMLSETYIDVTYIIEKINNQWTRTLDVDVVSLERALDNITNLQ